MEIGEIAVPGVTASIKVYRVENITVWFKGESRMMNWFISKFQLCCSRSIEQLGQWDLISYAFHVRCYFRGQSSSKCMNARSYIADRSVPAYRFVQFSVVCLFLFAHSSYFKTRLSVPWNKTATNALGRFKSLQSEVQY